jgi:hypothetical protein
MRFLVLAKGSLTKNSPAPGTLQVRARAIVCNSPAFDKPRERGDGAECI